MSDIRLARQKVREETLQIQDLLGKWDLFYWGYPEVMDVQSHGFIEFHVPKGSDPENPIAGEIEGDLEMCTYRAIINGLKRTPLTPVRGKKFPKDTAWEIESLVENPDYPDSMGYLEEILNVVYLSDVKDDKGNHFLVFDWTEGEGCHSVFDGFCIGHKGHGIPDKKELVKLGIGLSSKEVEERAKGKLEEEGVGRDGSSAEEEEDKDDAPQRLPGKRGASTQNARTSKRRKLPG